MPDPDGCNHRQGQPGDTSHLDEVVVTIAGKRHYLWRAVDQDHTVLDILVQKRRDTRAAQRVFRKLLKGLRYVPHRLVTDKLGSYGAARRELLPVFPSARTNEPTIEQKCHISQPDNRNARCAGLSLLATPNGFSRFTVPLTISFGSGGI